MAVDRQSLRVQPKDVVCLYAYIAQVAMDLAMAVVNKPHSRAAPAFKLL